MTKSLSKVNLASLKVLYTLMLLYERDLSMEELIKLYDLYHNETNSNFAMSKYINTCRFCGIDIKKYNNKYTLLNFPIGISFSDSEIDLFQNLKNCCDKINIKKLHENMQNIITKINRHATKPITSVKKTENSNTVLSDFEKACISEQKVKITLKDGTSYLCEPVDIFINDNKIMFSVFNDGNNHDVDPETIKQITICPQKSTKSFIPKTVIFELKPKLARRYQLRPNETVINMMPDGTLVISNKFEDKSSLLHRLMRYSDNCKIISPKVYVEGMKQLIEDTLNNYN